MSGALLPGNAQAHSPCTGYVESSLGFVATAEKSQNFWKRLLQFLFQGLNKLGVSVIASRLLDNAMRLPGSEPFRDPLSEGGFASQRGMDIWRLAGVALLLFRPILADERALVRGLYIVYYRRPRVAAFMDPTH